MSWNFMDPASRDTIDHVWRREAEGMFALVANPSVWEAPTAAGHWQVRDVIAHLVDMTEVYLHSFAAARGRAEPFDPISVRAMAATMDEGALALRGTERRELLDRLREDLDQIIAAVAGVSDEEWTTLMVPHKYMGPVPAAFFPICQMLDYTVHSWDVREGAGLRHGLSGDAADLLVPLCFLMWEVTAETSGVSPFSLGLRVTSGPNAGDTRVSVTEKGVAFERGNVDDLPAVVEFDPSGLVLTAFGRANTGTYRGDPHTIGRFFDLFFRV